MAEKWSEKDSQETGGEEEAEKKFGVELISNLKEDLIRE